MNRIRVNTDTDLDECDCDQCAGFTGAMYTFAYTMRQAIDTVGEVFKPVLISFMDRVIDG